MDRELLKQIGELIIDPFIIVTTASLLEMTVGETRHNHLLYARRLWALAANLQTIRLLIHQYLRDHRPVWTMAEKLFGRN